MKHKPDIIKLAVEAAGGRAKVADAIGVSAWTVSYWSRSRRMPSRYVRQLSELGGNYITVDELLAYIEAHAPETAAA